MTFPGSLEGGGPRIFQRNRAALPVLGLAAWSLGLYDTFRLLAGHPMDPWEPALFLLLGAMMGVVWVFTRWQFRFEPRWRGGRGAGRAVSGVRRFFELLTTVVVLATYAILAYDGLERLAGKKVNGTEETVVFAVACLASVLWILARSEIGPRRIGSLEDLKGLPEPDRRTRLIAGIWVAVAMLIVFGVCAYLFVYLPSVLPDLKAQPWLFAIFLPMWAMAGLNAVIAARMLLKCRLWRPEGSGRPTDQRP